MIDCITGEIIGKWPLGARGLHLFIKDGHSNSIDSTIRYTKPDTVAQSPLKKKEFEIKKKKFYQIVSKGSSSA